MEASETKPVTWTLLLTAAAASTVSTAASSGKSKRKKAPPQQQQQQRHTVHLSPDASITELVCLAASTISMDTTSSNDTTGTTESAVVITITSLKAGFPPRPLDWHTNPNLSLQAAGLQNKDRIVVDYKCSYSYGTTVAAAITAAAAAKMKKVKSSSASSPITKQQKPTVAAKRKKAKKKAAFDASSDDEDHSEEDTTRVPAPAQSCDATASTATSTRPRSKRAAAVQATEAFPQVLKAQDAFMQQQQQQQASSASKKRTRQTTSPASASPSKSQKATKFTASATTGRRLQDGSVVAPKSKMARQRRSNNKSGGANPTEDPGVALLGSLNDSNQAGRLMRKNWKQAVNSAYEQNQAVARLAAVAAGTVTMQRVRQRASRDINGQDVIVFVNVDNDDNKDGLLTDSLLLQVTFPKGIQGRGSYVDTVDYLPLEVLKSVVAAIHPADALKQENLALLSPRVFWSVLHHDPNFGSKDKSPASASEPPTTTAPTTCVHTALQALRPDLDWSFLRRRREQLSAKARENLRQEQESSLIATGGVANDYEAAAAAIASVEQAMGELTTHDRSQRQARVRAAALRRLQNDTTGDTCWQIVTPDELDEDELTECVTNSSSSSSANTNVGTSGQSVQTLVQALIRDCKIPNWRVLANANAAALAATLVLPVDTVTAWMVRAQQESVEEIIVEVCQGNVDAVELLRNAARSGTPKDLAAWRWIVDTLHEELVNYQKQQQQQGDEEQEETIEVPNAETLQLWCDRSQVALEQIEWLNWYATPIAE